jgi:tetratricopeptide (TPR) repeat protein
MSKIKVLFFAADPRSAHGRAPRLLLDEDVRQIRHKLRAAEHRDALELDPWLAARADDLIQALNQTRPRVVHFSGHGGSAGLVLASDDGVRGHTVDAAALTQLFEAFRGEIRVVVLNACLSLPQAEAIAEVVGCAIGTPSTISDEAAITFGASFYRAIAFGHSVGAAYKQARVALALEHFEDRECPVLVTRDDVDPAKLVLVSAPGADSDPREVAQAATPPRDDATPREHGPPSPAARPALTARARRWAVMAGAAATLVSGVVLVDVGWRAVVPIIAARGRAPVKTFIDPDFRSPTAPVTPGDLTNAKDLYEAENYAPAFPLFKHFAEEGNVEAKGYLGVMYLEGQGTSPNEVQAEFWLREAVKKRDARAMHGLGALYEMEGNHYRAAHWFRAAVKEHDYAPAMNSLAKMYAHGRYVKANRDSALALYKKAADAGIVEALVGAGEVHQRGLDGPRDTDAALRLYSEAAQKGSARAMEAIGRMYQEGDGVARDPEQARYWYQKAADAGSDVAVSNLALLRAD